MATGEDQDAMSKMQMDADGYPLDGAGIPSGAPVHADDGDGRLLNASSAYDEDDWAKHGMHSAESLRKTQQAIRQGLAEGTIKPQPAVEEQLSLNLATAVSRGVAKQSDMVNLPPHYARFKIEPIRFIAENKLDWFQGNIIKYVMRHDAKNGSEDIRKTIRYANMYLLFLQGDPDWWMAGKPEDFKVAA